MSRAAILPDCGDPCVALFWLEFFPRWSGEIDRLYFNLNSPVQPEIVDMIRGEVERLGGLFLYGANMIDHGTSLKRSLTRVAEEFVVFIENDAIVFKSGKIDEAFSHLSREFDIVASERCPASVNLANATRNRFGLNWNQEPFFSPNFFFTDVGRLRRTDQHFSGKTWIAGEYIKELDCLACPDDGVAEVCGDTFVWASIQLRAEKPNIMLMPQYHANVKDFDESACGTNLWDVNCGWLHYGSASSGYFQLLQNNNGTPLMYRAFPNKNKYRLDLSFARIPESFEEYQRRISWWTLCRRVVEHKLRRISGLNEDYCDAIERLIIRFGFDRNVIEKRVDMYRNLLRI